MAPAPISSAAPSAISTCCWPALLPFISRNRNAPRNAIGTEPSVISPTMRRFTVPLCRWTAAPTGRITTAATRSLEMAAAGLTENSRMSIGVIRAPPPAPVSPTSNPTTALPRTTYRFRPIRMLPSSCLAEYYIPYHLNLQLGNVGNICNGPSHPAERAGLPVLPPANPGRQGDVDKLQAYRDKRDAARTPEPVPPAAAAAPVDQDQDGGAFVIQEHH